ncbi:helix-turn-helix transcriptional regulator [Paraburkholderia sp. J94]|uniref:helix-turn-helix domain-containing protein n=1 Tax=Paraburkholderia sp. J94 TaxID=2805441 RepID=UPI002AB109DF|nr:helix-turn-helix transcriptional regulator [Paraburkholderia sp. J94]
MALAHQLIPLIKQLLRTRQLTYRDVGRVLELSEPSVKRLFASKRLSLEHLERIAELLGMTPVELIEASDAVVPRLRELTRQQEHTLVGNERLLLVTVCVINHWSIDDVVATYSVTEAECLKHVLTLDRMGILRLLPGNRIRLLLARDFAWISNGPIRAFFQSTLLPDFLAGNFNESEFDGLNFGHGMLTESAYRQLRAELDRLKVRLAALHESSSKASLTERRGVALLLASRSWEPAAFTNLRRSLT